ncbi:hypothetical protein BpHYR1_013980 [Brachionus plicatilis]|uniref:Uncharacterized protein n=1 Tax=Brachionus plicatilis TaxID=10195 RepID=A0A3M7SSN7_BRAPC|nr:hypothetical protein BpHYR1_013980 [Brachionus plicatilis]
MQKILLNQIIVQESAQRYCDNHLNASPYPSRFSTEHINNSMGLPLSSVLDTLPLPVVKPFRLNICRISCSPIAPGLSILLPSISTGQFITCSSNNSESSSAFDSFKR